jgi:hypothetical protein
LHTGREVNERKGMNNGNIYGWFFRGEVRFVHQGIFNAKYSLVANGSLIKVKNGVHIRLIQNQYGVFPEAFEIIAPMDAVVLINGSIPEDHIHYLPASEYLNLRFLHHGV